MRDVSGQVVADKAIVYNLNQPCVSPTGFLGTTNGPEASDPTWVTAANLTCNVGGNFRQVYRGKALPDTTGQAARKQQSIINSPAGTKHLSQLTLSPNPTTGEATMHFQLRDAGKLDISIQGMTGYTRMSALPSTTLEAGAHEVKLPLQTLRPGLYLVIVNSADGREVI